MGIRRNERMYRMMCRSAAKQPIQANAADNGAQPIDIWHERFGHTNYQTLQEAIRHDSFHHFKVKGKLKPPKLNCEGCRLGKQSRLTILPSNKRATSCGELLHYDICGPMSVDAPGGEKWLAIFVDDHSGFLMVIPLKKKSDIYEAMAVVLTEATLSHFRREPEKRPARCEE